MPLTNPSLALGSTNPDLKNQLQDSDPNALIHSIHSY